MIGWKPVYSIWEAVGLFYQNKWPFLKKNYMWFKTAVIMGVCMAVNHGFYKTIIILNNWLSMYILYHWLKSLFIFACMPLKIIMGVETIVQYFFYKKRSYNETSLDVVSKSLLIKLICKISTIYKFSFHHYYLCSSFISNELMNKKEIIFFCHLEVY